MKHTDFYPTQPLYVVTPSCGYNSIPKFEECVVREIKISIINSDNEIDVFINDVIQYRGTKDNLKLYEDVFSRKKYYFINKDEAFEFFKNCKNKYKILITDERKKQLELLKTLDENFNKIKL